MGKLFSEYVAWLAYCFAFSVCAFSGVNQIDRTCRYQIQSTSNYLNIYIRIVSVRLPSSHLHFLLQETARRRRREREGNVVGLGFCNACFPATTTMMRVSSLCVMRSAFMMSKSMRMMREMINTTCRLHIRQQIIL